MTPFSLLEYVAFAAVMALFAPLSSIARECMEDETLLTNNSAFFAGTYFLWLLTIACAVAVRAVANALPRRRAWRPAAAIVLHLALSCILAAVTIADVLFDVGPDMLRITLAAATMGSLIHGSALPLGFRSPWTPREPNVVNISLVRPGINANAFLTALFVLCGMYHLILHAGPILTFLSATGKRVL